MPTLFLRDSRTGSVRARRFDAHATLTVGDVLTHFADDEDGVVERQHQRRPAALRMTLRTMRRPVVLRDATMRITPVMAESTLVVEACERGTLGLRGGGGDGGATGAESRSAYLEMYAWNGGTTFSRKKESLGGFVRYSTQSTVRDRDEAEEDLARWFTCGLTEEPLETGDNGVVVDRLGALYNKEPVLKALRDKAIDGVPLPKRIEHITGMKALLTCKLEKRRGGTNGSGEEKTASVNARNFRCGTTEAVFACPITGLDFNGKTKFVVMRPSGVVVADKALREAKAAVEEMNDGLKLADAPPPIPVNPRGEELELLKAILEEEKAKKESKKSKKKDKQDGHGGKRKPADENGDTKRDEKPKKFKAVAPTGADASVYASLFTSSAKPGDNDDDHFLARNARKAW